MAHEVYMPRLTHDMTSGRLLQWLKKEDDEVRTGDPLFEVETDKAVSEVQAEISGVLKGITFLEGQEVPVGEVMAFIVQNGEEIKPSLHKKPEMNITKKYSATDSQEKQNIKSSLKQDEISEQRVLITPIARKLVKEYQIDLNELKGSGPRGKIVEADVRELIKQREQNFHMVSTSGENQEYEVIHLTDIQRITGERMSLSATSIPQFTLEMDVDMTEPTRLREFIVNQLGIKISYTTLLTEATAKALRLHPRLNASFEEGEFRCFKSINIGVAIATNQGLLAPVIRNADTLNLAQIQERINYFQSLAEGGKPVG